MRVEDRTLFKKILRWLVIFLAIFGGRAFAENRKQISETKPSSSHNPVDVVKMSAELPIDSLQNFKIVNSQVHTPSSFPIESQKNPFQFKTDQQSGKDLLNTLITTFTEGTGISVTYTSEEPGVSIQNPGSPTLSQGLLWYHVLVGNVEESQIDEAVGMINEKFATDSSRKSVALAIFYGHLYNFEQYQTVSNFINAFIYSYVMNKEDIRVRLKSIKKFDINERIQILTRLAQEFPNDSVISKTLDNTQVEKTQNERVASFSTSFPQHSEKKPLTFTSVEKTNAQYEGLKNHPPERLKYFYLFAIGFMVTLLLFLINIFRNIPKPSFSTRNDAQNTKITKKKKEKNTAQNEIVESKSNTQEIEKLILDIENFRAQNLPKITKYQLNAIIIEIHSIKAKLNNVTDNDSIFSETKIEWETFKKRLTSQIEYCEFSETYQSILDTHLDKVSNYKKTEEFDERYNKHQLIIEKYDEIIKYLEKFKTVQTEININYKEAAQIKAQLKNNIENLNNLIEAENLIDEILVFLKNPSNQRYIRLTQGENYKTNTGLGEIIQTILDLKNEIDKHPDRHPKYREQFKVFCEIFKDGTKKLIAEETSSKKAKNTTVPASSASKNHSTTRILKAQNTAQPKRNLSTASHQSFQTSSSPSSAASFQVILPENATDWFETQEKVLADITMRNTLASTTTSSVKKQDENTRKPKMTDRRWEEFREIYSDIQVALQDIHHYQFEDPNDAVLYFLRLYYLCMRFAIVIIGDYQHAQIRNILVHLITLPNNDPANITEKNNFITNYATEILNYYKSTYQQKKLPVINSFEKDLIEIYQPLYNSHQQLHQLKTGKVYKTGLTVDVLHIKSSRLIAQEILIAISHLQNVIKPVQDTGLSELQQKHPDRMLAIKQLLAFIGERFNYLKDVYQQQFINWKNYNYKIINLVEELMDFRNKAYHAIREPVNALALTSKITCKEQLFHDMTSSVSNIIEWQPTLIISTSHQTSVTTTRRDEKAKEEDSENTTQYIS